jgi:hypothetical protein
MESNRLKKAGGGSAARFVKPRLEALEDRSVPALVVTDGTMGATPAALVNALVGQGITVSNITYRGTQMSSGIFTGGTGIIGFESGIILSNGHAKAVVGPNNGLDSASFDNGLPGDAQLDALSGGGRPSFDATVLEFDFIPQGQTLRFNYVFGSEEYNKFVTGGFNDVFGFFVNGQNVALIPGTNTPVSIDTVNLNSNRQFYINNAPAGDPFPATPPLLNTELDGLSVVLPVTVAVNPGVVNHIKLGIQDIGDAFFDTDVFIQAGSLAAPPKPAFTAYRPFRYAFRSLEQNEGLSGPLPLGGPATAPTLDGNLTLLNIGNADATGPLRVEFINLPPGVQVLNASGIDPATNRPFITVPVNVLPAGGAIALRVPVKLSDPLREPLGTFFVGPYFVDVT